MSPEAQLRMEVYQQGQRAFNAGTACPYTDWRAGTWQKGRQAAADYYAELVAHEERMQRQWAEEERNDQ